MRRLIFALIMTAIFFIFLNFIYCNLGAETFGYEMTFKFRIPYLLALESAPIPLGFMLLITFCFGMIAISVLEVLPSFFKAMQIRSKNKRIKELERELTVARQVADTRQTEALDKLEKSEEDDGQ
jgi:ABC-type long-subunit fatty acid transport system fused permease/ATPase subunit